MENSLNFIDRFKNEIIGDKNRELFLTDFYNEIDKLFKKDLAYLKSKNNQDALDFENLKYAVFYSNPLYTLKKADIYFIGINPGGDVLTSYTKESLKDFLKPEMKTFLAYTKQNWNSDGTGKNKFQEEVINILTKIIKKFNLKKINLYDIFSTNLYFYRSKGVKYMKVNRDFWLYHELFLDIIKPKIIICCGNSETFSPYKNIREYLNGKEEKPIRFNGTHSIKWFYSQKMEWNRNKILVLGLPHLSYWDDVRDQKFDKLLKKGIEKF